MINFLIILVKKQKNNLKIISFGLSKKNQIFILFPLTKLKRKNFKGKSRQKNFEASNQKY